MNARQKSISIIAIVLATAIVAGAAIAAVMSNQWSRETQVYDLPISITVGPGTTSLPDWEVKAVKGTLYEGTIIMSTEVNTTVSLYAKIDGNITDISDVFVSVFYEDSWQGFPVVLTEYGMICSMTVPIPVSTDMPVALPLQIQFNKQGVFITTFYVEEGNLGWPPIPHE